MRNYTHMTKLLVANLLATIRGPIVSKLFQRLPLNTFDLLVRDLAKSDNQLFRRCIPGKRDTKPHSQKIALLRRNAFNKPRNFFRFVQFIF